MTSDSGPRACRVTLADFEGPMDLLLYLIRREELDITLIQVSRVADQYLAYIREAVDLNLDVAGEYLVMAATLTFLKGRSLLPGRREALEDAENPERALLRQLILYRAFREAAAELRESEEVWRDAFPPAGERQRFQESHREAAFDRRESGSLLDLLEALEGLARKEMPPRLHLVERPRLSTAECVDRIALLLPPGSKALFHELLGPSPRRDTAVSFFLAVLELMRRGWMRCRQEYPFSRIHVERTPQWA